MSASDDPELRTYVLELHALVGKILEKVPGEPPPSPRPPLPIFMDTAEFAEHLGVSVKTIRRQLLEGMPHKRIGKLIRIEVAPAKAWLDLRR